MAFLATFFFSLVVISDFNLFPVSGSVKTSPFSFGTFSCCVAKCLIGTLRWLGFQDFFMEALIAARLRVLGSSYEFPIKLLLRAHPFLFLTRSFPL